MKLLAALAAGLMLCGGAMAQCDPTKVNTPKGAV
jgi:hypothetical protein